MEENLGNLESRVQEIYDYQLDTTFIKDKLTDLEDLSRQSNLRIDSIKERLNETWEDCEKELEIDAIFKESLGIEEELVIERTHMMKTDKNKKSNTPTTIVCRILNYKDKVKILRNAEKTER